MHNYYDYCQGKHLHTHTGKYSPHQFTTLNSYCKLENNCSGAHLRGAKPGFPVERVCCVAKSHHQIVKLCFEGVCLTSRAIYSQLNCY